MADATGEAKQPPLRVTFDRRLKLEVHGARITSDGRLLADRELDDALGLRWPPQALPRAGAGGTSGTGCSAGYEDVNDAARLARSHEPGVALDFRADATFAEPEVYELLEAEGVRYAIRLPANRVLQERIAHRLTRPVGRPPSKPQVFVGSFSDQAQSWSRPRRVVAKVELHQGELYPRVGFIVTKLKRPPERVVKFDNTRGTAEQWIREGKAALRWTRLSCRAFGANAARLQLFALASNLANFQRTLALRDAVAPWSLTTLREKLVKACPCGGGDRRPERAPRQLRRLPAGGGGSASGLVRRNLALDRAAQTTAAAAPGMSTERNEVNGTAAGEVRP